MVIAGRYQLGEGVSAKSIGLVKKRCKLAENATNGLSCPCNHSQSPSASTLGFTWYPTGTQYLRLWHW
ncbi:hypothetical protein RvY_15005 [Ramazzottius varieornatus]|uniref:Uncharacterized protein n=1 Tax=Ramazzottius varieornatus TaxID=947166 RepID=A0A1D1W1K9_RAMVA|nr:hypothetical protein RvY_15005 [Ramazzottius varieornatus]